MVAVQEDEQTDGYTEEMHLYILRCSQKTHKDGQTSYSIIILDYSKMIGLVYREIER